MTQPKVLQVHGYYRAGVPSGEAVVFQAERRLLSDRGHSVVTYVRRAEEISGPAGAVGAAASAVWSPRVRRDLDSLLRRERPDVAHFHNTFPLVSPSAYAACRDAGVPVVQTLHNYRLLCGNGLLFRNERPCHDCVGRVAWRGVARACYRDSTVASAVSAAAAVSNRVAGIRRDLVDLYVAPSECARRLLVQGGLPGDRIVVKPNFVYPDPGAGDEHREGAIFVGRLSAEKGVGTLIRAWEGLQGRVPLTVVGSGPLAPAIAGLQEQIPNVRWGGALPPEATMALIRRARFLVFPSEWDETFGLAVIEAFAAGTPVIVSDRGAPADIVEHLRTGLVFPAGDPVALAAAAERLDTGATESAEMGRTARSVFEERYTGEAGYRGLLDVYRRVVAGPTKPAKQAGPVAGALRRPDPPADTPSRAVTPSGLAALHGDT